ncbi:unnamed protein product [Lactuca saligna]|uniref:Uncharacterized protein n=1 Tax=Lactuca saligna TaxID=75948 RepID=A0AA36A4S5_LACSI|nr:unnamed protein product [Lactuca saligna]
MKGVESRTTRTKREVSQARFRRLIREEEGVSGGSTRPKGKVGEAARLPSSRPATGSEFQASQAIIASMQASDVSSNSGASEPSAVFCSGWWQVRKINQHNDLRGVCLLLFDNQR